jgi:hypothetical protein
MISHYISEYESFLAFSRNFYATPYVWHKQLRKFVLIKSVAYQRLYRAISILGMFQLFVMITATTLAASERRESLVSVVLSIGITLVLFVAISMRSIHSQSEKAEDIVSILNCIIRCEGSFRPAFRAGNFPNSVLLKEPNY